MNREILFRAKAKATKEWAYGHFAKQYDVSQIYAGNGHECIYEDTLCQYTGLTDKNGAKIFEGDIVRIGRYFNNNFYTEDNYVCKYDNNTASFKFYYIVPKDITDVNKYAILGDGATLSDMGCGFTIEVIGNIYDNSDLIEK